MAIIKNDCSGCMEPFVLDTDNLTVTMKVPANGLRGSKHVPAHKVTAEVSVSRMDMFEWECPFPGCGYAESEYADDETRYALTGRR